MASNSDVQPIIKKVKKVGGHGHHGGAWKVAYADFVTAMMAFFLLMWLLNATSEEQRKGIADYFSPSIPISSTPAGGRAMFSGETVMADDDKMNDGTGGRTRADDDVDRDDEDPNRQTPPAAAIETQDAAAVAEALAAETADALGLEPPAADAAATAEAEGDDAAAEAALDLEAPAGAPTDVDGLTDEELRAAAAEQRERELEAVEQAFGALKEAHSDNILLEHLSMTLTPEGLVIEIAEVDGRPLFELGAEEPTEMLRALVEVVAPIIAELTNDIALIGHTDATPFAPGSDNSNWRLSAARADAARRLLLEQGLPEDRITRITGAAERQPLSDDPYAPENRRIGIILLRETPE